MSVLSTKSRLKSNSALRTLSSVLGTGVGVTALGVIGAEAQSNFTPLPDATHVVDSATGNARVTYNGQMYQVNAGHYRVRADNSLEISSEAAATVAPNLGSTLRDMDGGVVDGTESLTSDVIDPGMSSSGGELIGGVSNLALGGGIAAAVALGGLGFTAYQYLSSQPVSISQINGKTSQGDSSIASLNKGGTAVQVSLSGTNKSFSVDYTDKNWFETHSLKFLNGTTELTELNGYKIEGKKITYTGSADSAAQTLTIQVTDNQGSKDTVDLELSYQQDTTPVPTNPGTGEGPTLSDASVTVVEGTAASADWKDGTITASSQVDQTSVSDDSDDFDVVFSGQTGTVKLTTAGAARYQSGGVPTAGETAKFNVTFNGIDGKSATREVSVTIEDNGGSVGNSASVDYSGGSQSFDFNTNSDVQILSIKGASGAKLQISNLEKDITFETQNGVNNLGTIEVATKRASELTFNTGSAVSLEELDINNTIDKVTFNVTGSFGFTVGNMGVDNNTFDGPLVINATSAAFTADRISSAIGEIDADGSTQIVNIGSESSLLALTASKFVYRGSSASDNLFINGTATTELDVDLEAGDETFYAVKSAKLASKVDGGDGTDTLYVRDTDTASANVTYDNFEQVIFDQRSAPAEFNLDKLGTDFSDIQIEVKAGGGHGLDLIQVAAGTTFEYKEGISVGDTATIKLKEAGKVSFDFSAVDGADRKFGTIDVAGSTGATTLDLETNNEITISAAKLSTSQANTLKIDHRGTETEIFKLADIVGNLTKIDASDSSGRVYLTTDGVSSPNLTATGTTTTGTTIDAFIYEGSSSIDDLDLAFAFDNGSTNNITKFIFDTKTGADNVEFQTATAYATEVTIITGDENDNTGDSVKISSDLDSSSGKATIKTGAGSDNIDTSAVSAGRTVTIEAGSGYDKITLGGAVDTVIVDNNSGSAEKINTGQAVAAFNDNYDSIINFDSGTLATATPATPVVDKIDLTSIGLTNSAKVATNHNTSGGESFSIDLSQEDAVFFQQSSISDVGDLVQYFGANVTTSGNENNTERDLFIVAKLSSGSMGVFEWVDTNANGAMDGLGASDVNADTILKIAEVNLTSTSTVDTFDINDFV